MGTSSSKLHHPTRPSNSKRYRPGPKFNAPAYGYGYGNPVIPSEYGTADYDSSYGQPISNAWGFMPGPVIPPEFREEYRGVPRSNISHITPGVGVHQVMPHESDMGDPQGAFDRHGSRKTRRKSSKRRKPRKRTLTIRFSGVEPSKLPAQPMNRSPVASPAVHVTLSDSTDENDIPTGHDRPPRAPTPFHPPHPMEDSDNQSSPSQSSQIHPPQYGLHGPNIPSPQDQTAPEPSQHHTQRDPPQIHIHFQSPDVNRGVVHHAHPVVLPTSARFSNPLPEPPHDIFASSPYKHLLTPKALPEFTTHSHNAFIKRVITTESKPPKKGLLRAFSKKKPGLQRSKTIEYVYVPTPMGTSMTHPLPDSAPPYSVHRAQPSSATANTDFMDPIYFDHDSDYSGYLIQSPHAVCYEDKEYPTAAHLIDALKFLPHHPQIAEKVRQCPSVDEARRVAEQYKQYENPTHALGIVDVTRRVMELKIRQHADLQFGLVKTDPAPLKFNDRTDSFWGIGPDGRGRNELGGILERIREVVKMRPR